MFGRAHIIANENFLARQIFFCLLFSRHLVQEPSLKFIIGEKFNGSNLIIVLLQSKLDLKSRSPKFQQAKLLRFFPTKDSSSGFPCTNMVWSVSQTSVTIMRKILWKTLQPCSLLGKPMPLSIIMRLKLMVFKLKKSHIRSVELRWLSVYVFDANSLLG